MSDIGLGDPEEKVQCDNCGQSQAKEDWWAWRWKGYHDLVCELFF